MSTETTCSRKVSITDQKYGMELQKLRERIEFVEKERKEREKSEQDAARANQNDPSNEMPGTSKKPKMQ